MRERHVSAPDFAEFGFGTEAREARRLRRADRTCASCGETFTPPRSDGRYCAAACRQRAFRARRARLREDEWPGS